MKTQEKLAIRIMLLITRMLLGYSLNGEKETLFKEIEKELKTLDSN
jgi:hypothetical protein